MTLGERIKSYRKQEGLSQEVLAEKLSVSRQEITKWENDNGVPDIDNLIALSRMMGIPLDELILGENEENGPVITKTGAGAIRHTLLRAGCGGPADLPEI